MPSREALEELSTPDVIRTFKAEGHDPQGIDTRDQMIDIMVGDADHPTVADVEPEPEPEPGPTLDDEGLTTKQAGAIIAGEHDFDMSEKHEAAVRDTIATILNYDSTLEPTDFVLSTDSYASKPTSVFAVTNLSVPGARNCAKVVVAAEGRRAQSSINHGKIQRRRFHMR